MNDVSEQRPDGYEDVVAVLLEIEWYEHSDYGAICPMCDSDIKSGHMPDCRLGRIVARYKKLTCGGTSSPLRSTST